MYAIFFHAHQKIDRVAYRHLRQLVGQTDVFPSLKSILHFEGKNGPDATKYKKTPGVEQPWHFINPFDVSDTELAENIDNHYKELVTALKTHNRSRAAFEAAWLAHALVDGLTPPHHYPYEAELQDLRGEDRFSRNSLTSRVVVKGETYRDSFLRSLKIVGPKGLLTTHTMFEAGAYTIIAPLKLAKALPSEEDLKNIRTLGLLEYFQRSAKEVGAFGMYEKFYKTGWTPRLARLVRRELAPRMVAIVTLAWYTAMNDAGLVKAKAR